MTLKMAVRNVGLATRTYVIVVEFLFNVPYLSDFNIDWLIDVAVQM